MNEIYKYLNLEGKYRNAFDALIEQEKENAKASQDFQINIVLYILKLLIGIIISDFTLFLLLAFQRKRKMNPIVFITHYSHMIKSKSLNEIFESTKYSVLYVPTVHIKVRSKHLKYYRRNNNVHFDYFGISTFLKTLLLLFDLQILNELKKKNTIDFNIIFKNIIKYKVFEYYAKKTPNYKVKLWIFDNDRDPSFTPLIKDLNRNGKPTINLQHGMFFQGNKFYLPTITQFVFCCSDRENELFVKAGVSSEKVITIGAPLQIYGHEKSSSQNTLKPQFDVLVLLANTASIERLNSQIALLKMLSKTKNLKVLLRFRPSSVKIDYKNLKEYISLRFQVSSGNLSDDIQNSNSVITYSFDALFNCIIYEKRTILLYEKDVINQFKSLTNPLVINYESINKITPYLTNEKVSFNKNTFIWNFGEYDFNIYRDNFRNNCFKIINNNLN